MDDQWGSVARGGPTKFPTVVLGPGSVALKHTHMRTYPEADNLLPVHFARERSPKRYLATTTPGSHVIVETRRALTGENNARTLDN